MVFHSFLSWYSQTLLSCKRGSVSEDVREGSRGGKERREGEEGGRKGREGGWEGEEEREGEGEGVRDGGRDHYTGVVVFSQSYFMKPSSIQVP